MPSKKSKVFAYLTNELYERVSEFKQQRGLPSDSQTLIAILIEFFGMEQRSPVPTASNALEERIGQIEKAIAGLTKRLINLEETNGGLPGELVTSELEETNGGLPSELVTSELEETNGGLPNGETNGGLPSELVTSELEETNGGLPSELVTSELEETNGGLPSGETSGSLPGKPIDKDHLWVICKVDKLDRDRFSEVLSSCGCANLYIESE